MPHHAEERLLHLQCDDRQRDALGTYGTVEQRARAILGPNPAAADLKEAVAEAGRQVTPLVGKWDEEMTRAWEKKWTEVGGTIHLLSDADRKKFRRRVLPLGDKILGSNPKTKDMYELLRQAVVATRQM